MNLPEFVAFSVAAIALLGSPGPAIAALLAVGRTYGWREGLRFFWGLQVGLASAAGTTVLGLFAVLEAFPRALTAMSTVAVLYLLYLAYRIATSPVGDVQASAIQSPKPIAGTLLGLTNPKAYAAFASLFASFQIVDRNPVWDGSVKWLSVVIVMIVVDVIWLGIGVRIGRLKLSVNQERLMNYVLAVAIVLAAVLAFSE